MNRGDAIAAARALLPWWVTWLNVLVPAVLVFLASAASAWSAARVARKLVGDHQASTWPERVRRVFPVRRAVGLTTILAGSMAGAATAAWHGPLTPVPYAISVSLALLCAIAGVRAVNHHLARELEYPRLSLLAWSRQVALWMLALGPY